jgi:hypothetical protein
MMPLVFPCIGNERNARCRPHALISKLNQSILQEFPPLCPEYCVSKENGRADVHSKTHDTVILISRSAAPSFHFAVFAILSDPALAGERVFNNVFDQTIG